MNWIALFSPLILFVFVLFVLNESLKLNMMLRCDVKSPSKKYNRYYRLLRRQCCWWWRWRWWWWWRYKRKKSKLVKTCVLACVHFSYSFFLKFTLAWFTASRVSLASGFRERSRMGTCRLVSDPSIQFKFSIKLQVSTTTAAKKTKNENYFFILLPN